MGRFMESLHGLMTAQWDHDPTPNPSQEGTGQDADECLLPSWEGSGVGRFMESLLLHGTTPFLARSSARSLRAWWSR